MVRSTSQDFCAAPCRSAGDILPAPGMSLSITNLGIAISWECLGLQTIGAARQCASANINSIPDHRETSQTPRGTCRERNARQCLEADGEVHGERVGCDPSWSHAHESGGQPARYL